MIWAEKGATKVCTVASWKAFISIAVKMAVILAAQPM
jgi:hypothetical protein